MSRPVSYPPDLLDSALLAWTQDLAPHGIVVTDAELKIRLWNHWLQGYSKMSPAEVVGRSLFEVFPDLVKRRVDEQFRKALRGETTVLSTALHRYLLPFPSPVLEGPFKHMRQTARIGPLLMEGKVCGTITTIEDVTEREFQSSQTRQQQARDRLLSWALSHLLRAVEPENFLPELFRKTSEHLDVEFFFNYLTEPENDSLRLHTSGGLTLDQQKAFEFLDIKRALCGSGPLERNPVVIEKLQECRDPGPRFLKNLGVQCYVGLPMVVGEHLIGTLSFASVRRHCFESDEIEFLGTVAQYVAVAIDRTRKEKDLVAARTKLEEHAQDLEEKVEERTARLTDTVADLEGFCYTISHDLRAPIRHISSYVQAFREEAPKELPESANQFLHRIDASVKRMDLLTRDLLRYSKVSREQIRMETVDVAHAIKDIVEHNPSLRSRGVVAYDGAVHSVLAQPSLLQQCLSNLLENAVKFVPAGVEPRLVVRTEYHQVLPGEIQEQSSLVFNRTGYMPPAHLEDHSGHRPEAPRPVKAHPAARVRIWVEDNGIGIPPAFADKIFGLFERACDPHHFQGTGIGLAIVSKGMQRMGGRCGVEPQPGNGSRFWLELAAAE